VINIVNIIAENTIEQEVFEKVWMKRNMSLDILDNNQVENRLTIRDIKSLLEIKKWKIKLAILSMQIFPRQIFPWVQGYEFNTNWWMAKIHWFKFFFGLDIFEIFINKMAVSWCDWYEDDEWKIIFSQV